jgi:hypothetical protein
MHFCVLIWIFWLCNWRDWVCHSRLQLKEQVYHSAKRWLFFSRFFFSSMVGPKPQTFHLHTSFLMLYLLNCLDRRWFWVYWGSSLLFLYHWAWKMRVRRTEWVRLCWGSKRRKNFWRQLDPNIWYNSIVHAEWCSPCPCIFVFSSADPTIEITSQFESIINYYRFGRQCIINPYTTTTS